MVDQDFTIIQFNFEEMDKYVTKLGHCLRGTLFFELIAYVQIPVEPGFLIDQRIFPRHLVTQF